jgi:arylsulfatase A-like enzyme
MRSLATLAPLSALCGVVTALVFRRFASSHTRQTVNRILAHVMELRLFLDEPRLIRKAQLDLLRENLRLFGQIAIPSLIAAPLLGIVMWQADAVYGRAPLRAGEALVVTAHVQAEDLKDVRLEAPAGVTIETPGVRIPRLHEVSWRIRPLLPFNGRLHVSAVPERIDIPWPRATVLGLSWIVWFFCISSISALLAPRLLKRHIAILAVFICAHSAIAAEKTPVVLISIDTLRADHLSAYGYSKCRTPNIDAFADKGTSYLRIDSQIPLTMPSHTSLMTSTYPFENQVEENSQSAPPGAVTLASVLHANGYRTAAFIGSAMLDRRYGLDKGFDLYDSPFETAAGEIPNPYSARVRRDAALVTRAARQWIGATRGAPVFAFLHLYDLHTPYSLPQVAGLTPSVAGYDAELGHVDQVLGRFRDALQRDGFWDKALVILLADHGESLGDHGETSHGYFIYESTMHVPLIFHWPANHSKFPARVTESGGLIDVAPTILDFLQIDAPPSFEGVSLLSGHNPRTTYAESVYPHEVFGWAALRSLQTGNYKYIDAPRAELYDLSKDLAERVNILPAHPAEARAMKAWLDDLLSQHAPKPRPASSEPSAHTREVLGSLGYTAGGKQAALTQPADPKDKLAEQEAYERGLTFLYSGRYDQAILTLRRIVTEDAHNLPALGALGQAYLRSGNAARAIESWQQALERDPAYRPAAEFIGEYWLARKDYDKACRFVPAAPPCLKRQ